jgi:hypothetical protein
MNDTDGRDSDVAEAIILWGAVGFWLWFFGYWATIYIMGIG